MNPKDLASVRSWLQRRRRAILDASRRAAGAIDQLRRAERAAEYAEASQSEQLQFDLSQLGEVEGREIAQIDAAIARVDAGEYGTCRRCGEIIDDGRLEALPFVVDCAECADLREEAEALERTKRTRPRIMPPE